MRKLTSPIGNSKFFVWSEALYLPSWAIFHDPSEEEEQNIMVMAERLDRVRTFLKCPINVSCWLRPTRVNNPSSKHHRGDYNALVGGAPKSAHILGGAVDFHPQGISINRALDLIIPKLDEFQFSCEDNYGKTWVHLDINQRRGKWKLFKP